MNKLILLGIIGLLLLVGCTQFAPSGVPTLEGSSDFTFTKTADTSLSYLAGVSLYNPQLKATGPVSSNTVITFSCSGLPTGITCNFRNGNTCTLSSTQTTCTQNIEFAVDRAVEPRVHVVQLNASNGTVTKTLDHFLLIPNTILDEISIGPAFASAARGETIKLWAAINLSGRDVPMYENPLPIVWGNLPAGVTSTVNEMSCQRFSSEGACLRYDANLELSVGPTAEYLTNTLFLYAVDSEGIPKKNNFRLKVARNFSLSTGRIAQITKGGFGKTTVQVNGVSGEEFPRLVAFNCKLIGSNGVISNLPAGVTCSFTPRSCVSSSLPVGTSSCTSTLVVTVSSYFKTARRVTGSVAQSTTLKLRITGYNEDQLGRYTDMNITIK